MDKYLSHCGVGTRKKVKKHITQKRVTINGNTSIDPGTQVDPDRDVVCMDGREIHYEQYVYLMMNKPSGVITATEDVKDRTVLDLIDLPVPKDLAPVGRLDKDTVGLLLLTNDGALAHRLLAPRSHVDKTYFAIVSGEDRHVDETDVKAFKKGLELSDFTCMPAELLIVEKKPDHITETRVTIREGKFHQIKRMFAARGFTVTYLKRESMGPITLDPALSEGTYRMLTEDEKGLIAQDTENMVE